MRQMIYPQHEPKRLIVARLIIIFLIVGALAAIFGLQIQKAIESRDIYRTYVDSGKVKIPAIMLIGDAVWKYDIYTVLGKSVDTSGRNIVNNSVLDSNLWALEWGSQIYEGPFNRARNEFGNQTKDAKVFLANEDWRLTPNGINQANANGQKNRNFSEIAFMIAKKHLDTIADRTSLHVFLLERADNLKLRGSLKDSGPFNINLLNQAMTTRVQWGTQKVIKIQQSYVKEEAEAEPKYEVYSETFIGNPYVMIITIKASNHPDPEKDLYQIKTMERAALIRWYDFISLIGGTMIIALYVFTFLFGQRRLRPWGIVQRFMLRNQILSKIPRSVAVVGSEDTTTKKKSLGHDSVIGQDEGEIQHQFNHHEKPTLQRSHSNASQKLVLNELQQPKWQMEQMETALLLGNAQAVSEQTLTYFAPHSSYGAQTRSSHSAVDNRASYYSRPTNIRIDELEAFRQRVEAFYLASDLFEVQEGSETNKRNTLQVLTNLNL
ncbi:hypothetical protein BDF19DRAFT_86422 [Syncephalis fuscata]|nr:hypothetical protein BDF19DRAFT_86422 [Syncephalis fuscata]